MNANHEALLTEAARLAYPVVLLAGGSDPIAGEARWKQRIGSLRPGELAQVQQQLEAHAAQAERQDLGRRVAADVDARRDAQDAPLTEDERAEQARILTEAREAFERQERERPARVEKLLERIATAVERRG